MVSESLSSNVRCDHWRVGKWTGTSTGCPWCEVDRLRAALAAITTNTLKSSTNRHPQYSSGLSHGLGVAADMARKALSLEGLPSETTDDHEADLANQLQEVDRAFRGCLKELDGLRARMPTSDYILLSDTGEVHHKDYGMVLFATHDAVHSIEGIARSQEEPKATNGVWTSTWDQMPPKHVPVIMVRQGSEQIPRWHWRPLTAEASPVETKGIPETPEQWRARIEANALEDAHRMYEREHGEPFPGSGSK